MKRAFWLGLFLLAVISGSVLRVQGAPLSGVSAGVFAGSEKSYLLSRAFSRPADLYLSAIMPGSSTRMSFTWVRMSIFEKLFALAPGSFWLLGPSARRIWRFHPLIMPGNSGYNLRRSFETAV